MAKQWRDQPAGRDDYPPQPGMGLNEALGAGCDGKMELRRARHGQDDVTGPDRPGRFGKAGLVREAKEMADVTIAKAVAGRDLDRATDRRERRKA